MEALGSVRPRFLQAIFITLIFAVLLVAKDWIYVPTFRLFLDGQAGGRSSATQQFDIEAGRVVPLIRVNGPERVGFFTNVGLDSTVHVGLRASRPTTYAIEWKNGATHRTLAQGTVSGETSVDCDYPTGTGTIDFVSNGPLTWIDPRVVRDVPFSPYGWVITLFTVFALAWTRRGPDMRGPAFERTARFAFFKVVAATASFAAAVAASEVGLRALGDDLPRGIVVERHDLGEVTADPHWTDSPRYGRRLRANVDTLNEWREGDIVRMGFMPPPSIPGPLHRFAFHTDAEGFRNQAVRDRFTIAALGDSFTDAMTMADGASWPSQLERLIGEPVQNYGTAGFGPQQELLALKDTVAPHRPRTVVLAFFAGNDIFDAEAFEKFQRSGGVVRREAQGWRIKSVVSRVDNWFVTSALRAGGRWMADRNGGVSAAEPEPVPPAAVPRAPVTAGPSFDRGMFSLPIAGKVVQWAFMPPYLNTLNFSQEELAARPGWRLTGEAIREMQAVSRSIDANFVVMFIPFKSQVYLPFIRDAFPPDQLRSALGFSLERYTPKVAVDRLYANRLAQNALMQRLCADAGIPLLDVTAALQARLATGENVYFPDESHLNEAGEALVAEKLAAFLATLPR